MPVATAAKSAVKTGRRTENDRSDQGARSTRAPSPSSSQRHTQAERREKAEKAILAAAYRIVAERGFEALTLAEAGAKAGYSRALPGHYFASREALLGAVAEHIVETYLAKLQFVIQPRSGLEELLDRCGHYFIDGPKGVSPLRAFHAIIGAAPSHPEVAKPVAKLTEWTKALFAELVRIGIERGEIRKDAVPEAEAVWIVAVLRGVMAQWLVDPDNTPLSKVRDSFLKVVRRGLEA